jgi:hypothetical protein
MQGHRAVGEPNAHAHGDDGNGQGCQELECGRGEEGDAQRLHGGATVSLADLADRSRLPLRPAITDQGGQTPHDVEEVTRQGCRGLPPAGGRVLSGLPDQRGEQGEQRHGHHDDQRTDPVDEQQGPDGEDRQHHAGHEGGQIAGDIRFDGRGPGGREGEGLRLRGAGVGRAGQPAGEEPLPQRRRDPGAGSCRDPLGRGAHQGSAGQDRDDGEEGGADRHTADHGDDEGGDGEGLGDRQAPGDDPESRQGAHSAAGLGDCPEHSWVERSHRLSLRSSCCLFPSCG